MALELLVKKVVLVDLILEANAVQVEENGAFELDPKVFQYLNQEHLAQQVGIAEKPLG